MNNIQEMTVSSVLSQCARDDRGEISRHPFDLYVKQEFQLDIGINIEIGDMYQSHTNWGFLVGFPDVGHTETVIRQAFESAQRLFPYPGVQRVAIFPPVITFGTTKFQQCLQSDGRLGSALKEEIFSWEVLPKISTVAVLQSTSSFEHVLAVWWQEELGYPGENVLDQIRKLCWSEYVFEVEP